MTAVGTNGWETVFAFVGVLLDFVSVRVGV